MPAPSGKARFDIKVPVPTILWSDPSYAAIVGIKYYWSMGYGARNFMPGAVDCSHAPCGTIGAPGEYKTNGDNEGSIKYTGLRSIVWVEAECSPSPACIVDRNYSLQINPGGREKICASSASFDSGSKLTWSDGPLEKFIIACAVFSEPAANDSSGPATTQRPTATLSVEEWNKLRPN